VPNTINYKYPNPALIEIASLHLREIEAESFNVFPDVAAKLEDSQASISWVSETPEALDIGPQELLQSLKGKIQPKIFTQYNKAARDRSAALWALTCEGFRAGLTRDQVYFLAVNSANNKFDDRKYHAITDLRKDVLRAERFIITRQVDFKAVLMDMRQSKGDLLIERRNKMAQFVINIMREQGEFIHAKSGTLWFIRKDTGRPILITQYSEWLNSYLSSAFGLNTTEQEQRFVVHELINFVRSLPATADMQLLSYYDPVSSTLLLHTGGRDVLHVTQNGLEVHPNGYGSCIFQWISSSETWQPSGLTTEPWYDIIFGESLNHVVGIEKDEALAVLRSWFLFMLFRNLPSTRPILALFGQPGSGKTSIAKRLYRLIYGRNKNVSGLVDAESFDMAVITNPFVCFDNLDTWERWLPDKLALSASVTDVERRKLYTDLDIISFKRQAMLCITAHNPKFTREDVTDRLLLIMFSRLPHFRSETEFLEIISRQRNAIWNDIIRDVQSVLKTPRPKPGDSPQFRIEDFSHYGLWFARSIGPAMEDSFKRAIAKIQGGQRSYNLEEDAQLVSAITKALKARKNPPEFTDPTTLWNVLTPHAPDPELFRKTYRSAQFLARKLWVMQDSLKSVFDIEWQHNPVTNSRVWKIGVKTDA
jgi:GTPase SAR1 family protein